MNVVVVESPAKAKTVGRYGMRVPGRRRIWSSATSPPTHPIDCGSQTSPFTSTWSAPRADVPDHSENLVMFRARLPNGNLMACL